MTQPVHFRREKLVYNPLPTIQEFLDELEAAQRSPDYVRVVKNALTHFSDWAHEQGIIHPAEITRQHIIRFQAATNTNPRWGVATRQKMMCYIRSWIAWCTRLNYIVDDPWVSIKIGRTIKKPKPLEEEEVDLLFAAHRQGAFSMTPFSYHRREVILCLLYGWGLRLHELEALNVSNMDMNQDYVTAINKGGGTKSLPYTAEIKKVVQRWLSNRGRHAVPGENALLITVSGARLDKNQIYHTVVDLGDRAGVRINPHRLRDTCGTSLLDSDMPVEQVAKILGHSNTKQTLTYARVNDHKVKESLERSMDPRLARLFTKRVIRKTGDLVGSDNE